MRTTWMTTRKLMAIVAFVAMVVWLYVEWGRVRTGDGILVLASLMGLICPACMLGAVLATLGLLGIVMADHLRAIWIRTFQGRR